MVAAGAWQGCETERESVPAQALGEVLKGVCHDRPFFEVNRPVAHVSHAHSAISLIVIVWSFSNWVQHELPKAVGPDVVPHAV